MVCRREWIGRPHTSRTTTARAPGPRRGRTGCRSETAVARHVPRSVPAPKAIRRGCPPRSRARCADRRATPATARAARGRRRTSRHDRSCSRCPCGASRPRGSSRSPDRPLGLTDVATDEPTPTTNPPNATGPASPCAPYMPKTHSLSEPKHFAPRPPPTSPTSNTSCAVCPTTPTTRCTRAQTDLRSHQDHQRDATQDVTDTRATLEHLNKHGHRREKGATAAHGRA